jgi:hypothetical protein
MSSLQSIKMRFLDALCPPAFLYAIFLAINIGLDVADFALVTAAGKVVFGGLTIFILDFFCKLNLGVVSWVFIATPFVVTALATSIAMGIDLDRQVLRAVTKA